MTDWTRLDLELYVDGELAAEQAEALAEALRCNHELRARLAEVTRLNDTARGVLMAPVEVTHHRTWGPSGILAAAAALVLLIVLVWMILPPGGHQARPIVAQAPAPAESRSATPVRLIASIPIAETRRTAPPLKDIAASPSVAPAAAGLNDALARGAVDEVLQLLDESDEGQRVRAYRHLAVLIQSARSAERVLDQLPPTRQLEVCRLWAQDPQLRPVIFSRLRMLAADQTLAQEHAVVVEQLADDPRMNAWLRSYDLIDRRGRTG
jgi:anti-sigma factor RsiW